MSATLLFFKGIWNFHEIFFLAVSCRLTLTQEAGLIEHWMSHRLIKTAAFCEGSLIAEAQAISVMDVQSVFYACVIGIVLSFILLGGEMALEKASLWRQKHTVPAQKSTDALGSVSTKCKSVKHTSTPWNRFFSTFNPCMDRSSLTDAKPSVIPASRPPSWPKADTRSVWNFNTSFRRSEEEREKDGTDLSYDKKNSNLKYADPTKYAISVISLSRPSLRPAALRRRSSFTDLRHLRKVRDHTGGSLHKKVDNRVSNSRMFFSEGWFNPCFCDSDSSLKDLEDCQSDDGAASCDSGLDRSSVASTRFGDLESELW